MARTLSVLRATWVLDRHDVAWRTAGGWLEVLQEYHDGQQWTGQWVPCPGTLAELLAWLGY